jgi:hypothetical protein
MPGPWRALHDSDLSPPSVAFRWLPQRSWTGTRTANESLRLGSHACNVQFGGGQLHLVPTEATLALARGRLVPSLPPPSHELPAFVQSTHQSLLAQLLVTRLAMHSECTDDAAAAKVCIAVAPERGRCHDWERLCPGKRLVVIDAFDPDMETYRNRDVRLCPSLWRCDAAPRLVRLVANAPYLVQRFECGYARRNTLTIPYLGHARGTVSPRAHGRHLRSLRVAIAVGRWAHASADRLGFSAWRFALTRVCRARALLDNASCADTYPLISGKNALAAVALYRRATFCLQPPGDTMARAAIVDALSMGCIPVLFHPAQLSLWPWHWNATEASVFVDWSVGGEAGGVNLTERANRLFDDLLSMAPAREQALQHAVKLAARMMVYSGDTALNNSDVTARAPRPQDAVEVLVNGLLEEREIPKVLEPIAFRKRIPL